MNDRAKTALILGMTTLFMVSPLAMSLFWRLLPLFQNLSFERKNNGRLQFTRRSVDQHKRQEREPWILK